ncbi:hypothetical protein IIQ43_04045 [Acinetobacter oleivorans]|uniref:Uncharacterized protein n=1 Tax=Acinetobacter oleivorans TaxID=1148157 RepID=A0ABR9NH55_9GAMM|nr:hypothetical protein [Acinetobacter oleivorans]MBE2163707.1 hypothetical protein [Acinetobacter oleivorans]
MGEEESKRDGLKSNSPIRRKSYTVNFSDEFNYLYNYVYSESKLDLIDDFIEHYEKHGLSGWKGKISSSANVPSYYKNHVERSEYARQFDLWHVHIGLPTWQSYTDIPYCTSDQVIHFQKHGRYEITLLTISTHNPMDLPPLDMLKKL